MKKQITFLAWLLPLLSVGGARVLGSMVLPVYDDAFITFRYGRNLVEHGAFVYNSGEWILGTTSPLFGLLSAVLYLFHLPMPQTMVGLNIVLDIILAFLIYQIVSEEFGLNAAIFAVLFFAVSPILTRITVGGMEENLFLLFTFSAFLFFRKGKMFAAIFIASISYFLRPEGAALALYLIALVAIRKEYGQSVKLAALSFLSVLPGLVLLYVTYGSFISHSVIAKSGEHQAIVEVFKRLVIPEPLSILVLLFCLFGITAMWQRKGFVKTYMGFVAVYLGAYLVMRPWIWSWYAMPIQVGLVIGAGIGVARLVERFSLFAKPLWYRSAPVVVCLCAVGVWMGLLVVKGSSGITRNIYGSLATSLPQLDQGSVFATDIGAVGYYSNARVLDGLGLVTPGALKYLSSEEMIKASDPDALFLNTSKETRDLMASDLFSSKYTFARRFGPSGNPALPSDSSEYIDGWQQDYLLYVRRK